MLRAAALRIWYAASASNPPIPFTYASATTTSALAPIIVPASPSPMGHLGNEPEAFAIARSDCTASVARSGATRSKSGCSVRYVSQRDISEQ